AEPRHRLVRLRQGHQEALHPPRPPDEHEQQPGREGIERARVAGLAHAEAPAREERQVVRGLARRLVDEDESVHAGRSYSWVAICSRRNATSSEWDSSVVKPAARRWPPPPPARAIAETSTSPSVERSDTFLRAPPPSNSSRASPATFVPSTERRWSMMP